MPTGYHDLDAMLLGLQPSNLVIVAARPSAGKCVAWDTPIVDPVTGAMRTAAEVHRAGVAGEHVQVLALGDDLRLHRTVPSAFVDDGVKPVYRVRTRLGREVRTTITHPFLTPSGWRPLADIEVGTRIAVPRCLAAFGRDLLPEPEAVLLGFLIGDGNLTDCSPRMQHRVARDPRGAPALLFRARGRREVPGPLRLPAHNAPRQAEPRDRAGAPTRAVEAGCLREAHPAGRLPDAAWATRDVPEPPVRNRWLGNEPRGRRLADRVLVRVRAARPRRPAPSPPVRRGREGASPDGAVSRHAPTLVANSRSVTPSRCSVLPPTSGSSPRRRPSPRSSPSSCGAPPRPTSTPFRSSSGRPCWPRRATGRGAPSRRRRASRSATTGTWGPGRRSGPRWRGSRPRSTLGRCRCWPRPRSGGTRSSRSDTTVRSRSTTSRCRTCTTSWRATSVCTTPPSRWVRRVQSRSRRTDRSSSSHSRWATSSSPSACSPPRRASRLETCGPGASPSPTGRRSATPSGGSAPHRCSSTTTRTAR